MIGGRCLLVRVLVPAQVVALCQAPFLLDDPNVGLIFPADAIARAKHYLSLAPGGLGNIFLVRPKFIPSFLLLLIQDVSRFSSGTDTCAFFLLHIYACKWKWITNAELTIFNFFT